MIERVLSHSARPDGIYPPAMSRSARLRPAEPAPRRSTLAIALFTTLRRQHTAISTFTAGLRRRRRAQTGNVWRRLCRVGMRPADRKSVVEGKSVSVRVDLGGCRIIKKKNQKTR